jgi:hypothetical protein
MAAPSFTMDSEELDMPSCLILPSLRHALNVVSLGTTSQKAELTALARALTLAKDKTVNIYMTLSMHSTLYCPTPLSGRKGDS